jgi:hypothetical protein
MSDEVVPLYCEILKDTIRYEPTPLDYTAGETVAFRFNADAGPPEYVNMIEAHVYLYDPKNQKPAASVGGSFPRGADGLFHVQLEWDGTLDEGGPAPSGDYGPTFTAKAAFADQTTSLTACSGVTTHRRHGFASDCVKSCDADPQFKCDILPRLCTGSTCEISTIHGPPIPGSSEPQSDFNLPRFGLPTISIPRLIAAPPVMPRI